MVDGLLPEKRYSRAPLVAREYQWLPVTNSASTGISLQEFDSLRTLSQKRPGLCEASYGGIRLKHYCGIVSLGERSLEIIPKLGIDDVPTDLSRGHLLRWLRDSGCMPTPVLTEAAQSSTSSPLLDTFISAFFGEVARTVSQGLLHRYKSESEDLASIRGRINWPRQSGTLWGRPDRMACTYDEFTADISVNQIVKYALRAVLRQGDRQLSRRAATLLGHFESVSDIDVHCLRGTVSLRDRQIRRYEGCLAWAWLIIDTLSPSLRHGDEQAPGLLFDMNKVFEAIAVRCISADIQSPDFRVSVQDASSHLGFYGEHAVTQLRPDIVVWKGQQRMTVADAKWKRLEVDSRGVPILNGHDVYQLLSYAAAMDLSEVSLVYPLHDGLKGWTPDSVKLRIHDGGTVNLSILLIDLASDSYDVTTSASWYTGLRT
ncbi:McrC family protein [Luteibacter aegosomaticola]|uniref:McrC family protein n=1 Tax=Luteibacter aegosomaticola TaxID=2911538 RepID=UPI001FFB6788|nr:McrC family protein [Luteibacter aegosomaticola]UPG89502.1 McrC family protein [Luteibacter aegosomaticola]